MRLSDLKIDAIAGAQSPNDYWYITKQECNFRNLCYIAELLSRWNDDSATNYEDYFNSHKTSKPFSDYISKTAHRATINLEPYGLAKFGKDGYKSRNLCSIFYTIKQKCQGDFSNTALYQDIIDKQVEKITIETSNIYIRPTMFTFKVLLTIGDCTGDYSITIQEFRIFVASSKDWSDYFQCVESILRFRNDSSYNMKCIETAKNSSVGESRYNRVLKNHSFLDVNDNRISIANNNLNDVRKIVAEYEMGEEDLHNLDLPNIKVAKEIDKPLQQIFYGAPGTGKSFAINDVCAKYENYRTTFHPDSDYASFVGSYKPITQQTPLYGVQGQPIKDSEGENIMEDRIVYRYVFQSFLKAYIAAWKEQQNDKPQPVFLIVEEINRGNCAQIFGDIFQLLDRNSEGFSDYPIEADEDLANELRKVLNGLTIANKEHINALYKGGKDVVAKVMSGAQLLLPNNLYIWATMNTSDQSLFPIDSAFKRRWDWKYIKIKDSNENYIVRFSNGHSYDWWKFVSEINKRIEGGDIQQEDKKLGYFFAKAKDSIISAETLVSKVLFYLYSDVFKDFGFEEDFFKDENGEVMTFASYFDGAGDIDETRVEKFVTNLGLTPIGSEAAEVSDDTETMEEPETAEENSEE